VKSLPAFHEAPDQPDVLAAAAIEPRIEWPVAGKASGFVKERIPGTKVGAVRRDIGTGLLWIVAAE
jgi:hypothetical protein